MHSAAVSVILVSLAFCGTATQTDWSAGPGVQGPVLNWENFFWSSYDSVIYNSGKLQLCGPTPPFAHTVDDYFDGACSVYSTDVDGDGDKDVLGAAFSANDITWWENADGAGTNWIEHSIDGNFDGRSVYSADIDGDGDADVLGAAYFDNEITWWENCNGAGTSWTEHTIDEDFNYACSVYSSDVDGDGDADVMGAANNSDQITWWENSDGAGIVWIEHSIDSNYFGAFSVYSTDVDGDGDADILGASYGYDEITWWENSDGTGTTWTEHTVDGNFDGASSVYSSDVDGDGDSDILGTAIIAEEVAWWENTDGAGTIWIKHTVEENFVWAESVYSIDVDCDGDADVLATGNSSITWWENTDGTGTNWTKHTVDGDFIGACSVFSADLDGDGNVDILGVSSFFDEITWWNVTGYPSEGSLESSILDAGNVGDWNIFLSSSQEPAGTSVSFQFRSSDDSSNMGAWSDTVFSPDTPLGGILADSTRYLQYKVILKTSDIGVSPELAEVAFSYTLQVGVGESGYTEIPSWSLHSLENPSTGFFSALVSVSEDASVELSLYDVSGRVVAEVTEELPAGTHSVNFAGLAQGVYFCTMRACDFAATERVVVLR